MVYQMLAMLHTYEAAPGIVDLDADPFVPSGMRFEPDDHVRGGQRRFAASELCLYQSQWQANGGQITGEALLGELDRAGMYNANLLDFLVARPHLIPLECDGYFVAFLGTIYTDGQGRRHVRVMYKDEDGEWTWMFVPVSLHFGGKNAVAVRATC